MTSAPVVESRELPRVAALVLAMSLLVVAWWAMPRHIAGGDAGELGTVLLAGGVPHPPGYPWMRMLGPVARAAWACGLPAAMAAALPCTLAAIVGWVWIARTVSRWCPWPIAVACTWLVATAHTVVLHTCDAEVWGPLVLATAALLSCALGRRRPAWVVGVVFGAALAVHLTLAFLLPLVVAAAWPPPHEAPRSRAVLRAGLVGLGGTLLGLGVFATLLVGSDDAAWRWGELDSVGGLVRHVLRSDYGTFSLSLHDASPGVAVTLARATGSAARAWSFGLSGHPAVFASIVVLVAVVVARTSTPATRGRLAALAASWVLAGLVFPAMHDIDPRAPTGAWILERFDILPLALSVPAIAIAVAAGMRAVQRDVVRVAAVVAAVAAGAQQLATTALGGVASDDDAIEVYARDLLRTPPPGGPAIVLGTDDHRTFAVLFAQSVLGEGPQVVYVDASLLAHPWYRAALRRRLPVLPDEEKPVQMLLTLWQDPQHRTIPVYLANDFSRPSTTLPRVPEGVLWRVLPEGPNIDPEAIVARHVDAWSRLVGPPEAASSPFARDLAALWPAPHEALRRALQADGRIDLLERVDAASGRAREPDANAPVTATTP
jgi:hypothetical protein